MTITTNRTANGRTTMNIQMPVIYLETITIIRRTSDSKCVRLIERNITDLETSNTAEETVANICRTNIAIILTRNTINISDTNTKILLILRL